MRQHGFTLMELLIVIAILGVLAILGVNAFIPSMKRGRDAKRVEDLAAIQSALELYYTDHGEYPPDTLGNDGQIVSCGNNGSETCEWGGGQMQDANGVLYLRLVPEDPQFPSHTYYYIASADNKWYKLYACLENTEDPRIRDGGYASTRCEDCRDQDSSIERRCNYGVASPNETPD